MLIRRFGKPAAGAFYRISLFGILLLGSISAVCAEVRLPAIISDGLVLQQGMNTPIFGTADEGEQVKATLQEQTVSTIARDGKWLLRFGSLKPGGPFEMTIAGKNRIEFKNVFIGEVWLCSGQSNMAWPVRNSSNAQAEIRRAQNPFLRLFSVPRAEADEPSREVGKGKGNEGKWLGASPGSVPPFSAVCYFFGSELQKTLAVPVGLINASAGGSRAEAWTPELTLRSDSLGAMPKSASLYNGMIAPLIPFDLKGVVWYQGEGNTPHASRYRTLLPALINSWRAARGAADMPFLFVQLSSWGHQGHRPQGARKGWPGLREAQLLTSQTVPRTAMVVSFDAGDGDLHPRNKQPVGQRLALAARAIAYGEKLVYSGPIYESMTIDGNKTVLRFKHTGLGLTARGGELRGFTVAGADRRFLAAQADIRGDQVVVSSEAVAWPVAVRYGWSHAPEGNLCNRDGLPASPFRTDDWPDE